MGTCEAKEFENLGMMIHSIDIFEGEYDHLNDMVNFDKN